MADRAINFFNDKVMGSAQSIIRRMQAGEDVSKSDYSQLDEFIGLGQYALTTYKAKFMFQSERKLSSIQEYKKDRELFANLRSS